MYKCSSWWIRARMEEAGLQTKGRGKRKALTDEQLAIFQRVAGKPIER